MRRALRIIWAVGLAVAPVRVAFAQEAQRGKASTLELSTQVEALARQVRLASDNLVLVEKQYTLVAEPTDEASRMARFSDGEINYLLGDYPNAAVLFYDLVANKDFQANARYPDALFYLADALYQQKNYLGSRLYLRQLLDLKKSHYKEALARYLEIAGRINEFAGIDQFIEQARGLSGGQLSPELNYVYAKWLFRREDLPLADRVARAQQAFSTLSQSGTFKLQAAYFIGVGYVKLRQWDKAGDAFAQVASMPATGPKDRAVKELAALSLGRVLFEAGKFIEAIDRYQEIPRESDNFPDSLYETAWAYVRMNDYQRAYNATEVLGMVAEGSVLAPEAKILKGTLLLKLQKYEDATETFNGVINDYAPVRDEIDALLSVHQDPVRYFDDLLARNDKNLDVTSLLPPVALKWATTRREVAEAVEIMGTLEAGRKGVDESKSVADRILKALDERGLETFPMMQEGYTRADAVETSLSRAEESLTRIEGYLSRAALPTEQLTALEAAKAEAESLRTRLATLPANPEEVQARKKGMQERIDTVDQQAFRMGLDIQAQAAQIAAIQKYVDDTRSQRKTPAEDEKAFLEKVVFEKRSLEGLQTELEQVRQALQDERNNAENAISGDEVLKKQYAEALEKERRIYESARRGLGNDASAVLLRADVVRADAAGVRERVGAAKQVLRERVVRRAQKLRDMVLMEQALLDGYGKDVVRVSLDARDLVGRIAFDSFKRVRQSFYDLVLKADVGVVDVAFTRKQDKTQQIQKLSQEKDQELKHLDDEFKEVLKDAD